MASICGFYCFADLAGRPQIAKPYEGGYKKDKNNGVSMKGMVSIPLPVQIRIDATISNIILFSTPKLIKTDSDKNYVDSYILFGTLLLPA